MNILIDQDEILAQWLKRVIEYINKDTGSNYSEGDITTWDIQNCLGPEAKHAIRSYMRYPYFYRDLEPVEGAVDGMKYLIEQGHDVSIVTAVPKSATIAYVGKIEWLRQHMPFFDLNKFHACHEKFKVHGDVLLDDRIENIEDFRNKGGLAGKGGITAIFTRPWNKDYNNATVRIDHWHQFLSFIDNLSKTEKK